MAISIIYTINNTVYYYKGFIDQFNKVLNYRNNSLSSLSSLRLSNPFIFIINNKNDIKKDKENLKQKKKRAFKDKKAK